MAEILKPPYPPSKHFVPCLKKIFLAANYQEEFFVARHFSDTRTDLVFKTGTDRDENSYVWDTDSDVDHQKLREQGISISPANIFYALSWKFDLEHDNLVISDFGGNNELHHLSVLDTFLHYNLAIYDYRQVERKSEVEYWFRDPNNKLNALLAVLILKY
jgi:hypothetical protein